MCYFNTYFVQAFRVCDLSSAVKTYESLVVGQALNAIAAASCVLNTNQLFQEKEQN